MILAGVQPLVEGVYMLASVRNADSFAPKVIVHSFKCGKSIAIAVQNLRRFK